MDGSPAFQLLSQSDPPNRCCLVAPLHLIKSFMVLCLLRFRLWRPRPHCLHRRQRRHRFNEDGKKCVEQEIQISDEVPFKDHGETIMALYISQCVLYILLCICMVCVTDFTGMLCGGAKPTVDCFRTVNKRRRWRDENLLWMVLVLRLDNCGNRLLFNNQWF